MDGPPPERSPGQGWGADDVRVGLGGPSWARFSSGSSYRVGSTSWWRGSHSELRSGQAWYDLAAPRLGVCRHRLRLAQLVLTARSATVAAMMEADGSLVVVGVSGQAEGVSVHLWPGRAVLVSPEGQVLDVAQLSPSELAGEAWLAHNLGRAETGTDRNFGSGVGRRAGGPLRGRLRAAWGVGLVLLGLVVAASAGLAGAWGPFPAPARVAQPAPARVAQPAPARVAQPARARVAHAARPVPAPAPTSPAASPVPGPAPSGRFSFRAVATTGAGGADRVVLVGQGVQDLAGGQADLGFATPGDPQQEARLVDGKAYVSTGPSSPGAAPRWVEADLAQVLGPGYAGALSALIPTRLELPGMPYRPGETRAGQPIGTQTIDGVAMTGHLVTIDPAQAGSALSLPGQLVWAELLRRLHLGPVVAQVWVDGHGQAHQISYDLPLPSVAPPGGPTAASHPRLEVTLRLFDLGVPVEVAAPPPSRIVSTGPAALGSLASLHG